MYAILGERLAELQVAPKVMVDLVTEGWQGAANKDPRTKRAVIDLAYRLHRKWDKQADAAPQCQVLNNFMLLMLNDRSDPVYLHAYRGLLMLHNPENERAITAFEAGLAPVDRRKAARIRAEASEADPTSDSMPLQTPLREYDRL